MMLDPTTLLVVGSAVAAPMLLVDDAPKVTGTGLVEGDPRTVLGGHKAAAEFFRSTSVVGIGQTKSSASGLVIVNRLLEVLDALKVTHGAVDGEPNVPRLSPQEAFDLVSVLLEAVRIGVIKDGDNGRDGYVLSDDTEGCGAAGDIVLPGACERLVSQETALSQLTSRAFGGVPPDFDKPTALATAIGEAINQRFLAQTQDPNTFKATAVVRAAGVLASEMDGQGVTFAPVGLGELVEAIDNSIARLPGRAAGLVTGLVGDALGAILLSTPVLLLVGGLVVYKAVQK